MKVWKLSFLLATVALAIASGCSSEAPTAANGSEPVSRSEEELNLDLCTAPPPPTPGVGVCEAPSWWKTMPRSADAGACPSPPLNRSGTPCTQIVLGRSDCYQQYIGCPGYVALSLAVWTPPDNDKFVACAAAGRLGATCDVPIYVCSNSSSIPDPGAPPTSASASSVTTTELCQLKASGCHVLLNQFGPGAVADCPKMKPSTLAGCNKAGDFTDDYRGVTVNGANDFVATYCNDPAAAGQFQCDQFANRFVSSMNLPPLDDYVNNYACQICDLVNESLPLSALYSVWGPGYRPTAGHQPQSNDLLVFDEGVCSKSVAAPGHVAVVTGADSNNIYYIQQNWILGGSVNGSLYASLPRSSTSWNASTSFFGNAGGPGGANFHPRCWVHPECPPYSSCNPGPTHNPCVAVSHANNGLYCGGSSQGGFFSGYARSDVLYTCVDGQVANETFCSTGCKVEGAGVKDHCSLPRDPCNDVPNTLATNGFYCGASKQNHFNDNGTADPNSLYDCENGNAAHVAACFEGCFVSTSGPDGCAIDACQNVPSASNGLYCGRSPDNRFLPNVSDPKVVYTCRNQHTIASAACGSPGCVIAPSGTPGTADSCVQNPCANVPVAANGRFCGSSLQSAFNSGIADPKLLYMCLNGKIAWTERCSRGCYIANAGQDDGCL